jgi:hypothetical protein
MAVKKTATKKTTTKTAPVAKTAATPAAKKSAGFLEGFNREDNLHMFLGIILLVIGLYQLRTRLLGLVFIIVGILFVTGYFEKGKRK